MRALSGVHTTDIGGHIAVALAFIMDMGLGRQGADQFFLIAGVNMRVPLALRRASILAGGCRVAIDRIGFRIGRCSERKHHD